MEGFLPPAESPPPRSLARRGVRRLWYKFLAWILADDDPDAGAYRDLVAQLVVSERLVLELRGELAAAGAEKDAAVREVAILSLVCTRNEERVQREIATEQAGKERATNAANARRADRANGDV